MASSVGKLVVGIGGVTCGGKTTLTQRLLSAFPVKRFKVINQDDYFLPENKLESILGNYWNYDCVEAIDFASLLEDVNSALQDKSIDVIIIEGNMIFGCEPVFELCNLRYFLTLTYSECEPIRSARRYEPPDVPGYFDQYVWPAYVRHLEFISKKNETPTSSEPPVIIFDASRAKFEENLQRVRNDIRAWGCIDWIDIIDSNISISDAIEFVSKSDGIDGAVSLFIGKTRKVFEDKQVKHLEYEAYLPMALKQLKEICLKVRSQWTGVSRMAIIHRIGTVPVGEPSVVIAVSSPHRADALKATEFSIDEIKATVPIWKKELYEDCSSNWK